MADITFEATAAPSVDDAAVPTAGLEAYNIGQVGTHDWTPLAVFARREGSVIGGLNGHTHWQWLHIRHLWVDESLRAQGVGTRLLGQAERVAAERGCIGAHLDTFSFQALPFYLRLGYRNFGTLDDYPVGATRHFLWKPLMATPRARST